MALNLEKGMLLSCTLLADRHRLNGFVRIFFFFLCSRFYDYIFHPFRLHLHSRMRPRAVEIPQISRCIEVVLHTTNFTLPLRQGYVYVTFILFFSGTRKVSYLVGINPFTLTKNYYVIFYFVVVSAHICLDFRYLAVIAKEK